MTYNVIVRENLVQQYLKVYTRTRDEDAENVVRKRSADNPRLLNFALP